SRLAATLSRGASAIDSPAACWKQSVVTACRLYRQRHSSRASRWRYSRRRRRDCRTAQARQTMRLALRRTRTMPSGAEPRDAGVPHFRLWAPGADRVALWLDEEKRVLRMPRDSHGWATLATAEAPPGTRYRYQIDGALLVPDPASRFQPDGVHGPSEVVDPYAYSWPDAEWTGVAAERLGFYELHVGTFTRAGTFAAPADRIDHLAALGVTAIELMPVGEFPGRRGWGYDGVLLFAPAARYGRPEDLKAFVAAAHARGMAVFLDVVYNHFGPEGNYLPRYAPAFFEPRRQTPWGAAINFDGPGSEIVRTFIDRKSTRLNSSH